jgi:hypothetical protein
MQTLAFLLAVAPQAVQIHPNSVWRIDPIRGAAQAINTLIKDDSAVHKWAAAFRGAVIENAPPVKNKNKLHYVPPTSKIDAEDKVKETIAVLNKAWKGVRMDPCKLPRPVFQTLARNVPKGKLQKFMKERPEHFTVHEGIGGQVSLISLSTPRTCGTQFFQQ